MADSVATARTYANIMEGGSRPLPTLADAGAGTGVSRSTTLQIPTQYTDLPLSTVYPMPRAMVCEMKKVFKVQVGATKYRAILPPSAASRTPNDNTA